MRTLIEGPTIVTSRKSATPSNSLLRSRERGVVLTRSGGVLYSPPSICQEIWDLRLSNRDGVLAAEIGGRTFGEGIPSGETLRKRLLPVSTDIASAIGVASAAAAVKKYTPWNEAARYFWSETPTWLLGGGVTEGGFGELLAREAGRILGDGFKVQVSARKRWSGLAGSAEFLPPSALDPKSPFTNYLGLDLGGSSLKISLIQVNSRTGKTVSHPFLSLKIHDRPADIPFNDEIHVNSLENKLRGSRRIIDWIAKAIVGQIIDADRKGIKLSPNIVIGVAFEVDETGRRISGGTYPFPSKAEREDFSLTREIGKRVEQLLTNFPETSNSQAYAVTPVNDAIMAAAGSISDDLLTKFGYLALGSGVGGALFIDPADLRYSRYI